MHSTGKELENAVEQIEQFIFNSNPALTEAEIRLEKRKIIISNGTKHEIDIYAEINLGSGYNSTFIFECKDWSKPVGKNEIIVFIEKIKVTIAQKGFFIAKSFTKDAVAQAKNDNRLQLIYMDTDFAINHFPNLIVNSTHLNTVTINALTDDNTFIERRSLNTKETIIRHYGQESNFSDFFLPIVRPLALERIKNEPVKSMSIGEYPYSYSTVLDFSGKGILADDFELGKLNVTINFDLRISEAKILSKFDIKTRGRIVSFEPIESADGTINISFIEAAI
jgi:hypothetical protein